MNDEERIKLRLMKAKKCIGRFSMLDYKIIHILFEHKITLLRQQHMLLHCYCLMSFSVSFFAVIVVQFHYLNIYAYTYMYLRTFCFASYRIAVI